MPAIAHLSLLPTLGRCMLLLSLLLGACAAPDRGKLYRASTPATPVEHVSGPWQVTLLPGGREVEFLGEIDASAMQELAAVIRANPKVEVLQLTSPGGRLGAALEVVPVIEERRLTTVVPLYCASACTHLFLAGKERVLLPGAGLGFHRARFSGADATLVGERIGNDALRASLLAAGLSGDFADRVLATPPDSFWYPDAVALRQAGLDLDTPPGRQFAPPSIGTDLSLLLDWSVLNDPVFWSLETRFPEVRARLRQAVAAEIDRQGFAAADLESTVDDALTAVLEEAVATTSPRALVGLFTAIRDYVAVRDRRAPGSCFETALWPATQRPGENVAAENTQIRLLLAMAEVFETVAVPPVVPPSRAEVEEALANMVQRMDADRQAALRDLYEGGDLTAADKCLVVLLVIDAALEQPSPDRETILRSMLRDDADVHTDSTSLGS